MIIRKHIATVLLGLAVLGLAASPAQAATWTVRPGGSITAVAARVTIEDTTTGVTMTCTSSSLAASFRTGSGLSGTAIASITALSFSRCTDALGIPFAATATGFPYALNAGSYSSGAGVTSGNITGIDVGWSSLSGCHWWWYGQPPPFIGVTYANGSHQLTTAVANSMFIYNSAGCAGLFNNGDATRFTATYTVSPAQVITSP